MAEKMATLALEERRRENTIIQPGDLRAAILRILDTPRVPRSHTHFSLSLFSFSSVYSSLYPQLFSSPVFLCEGMAPEPLLVCYAVDVASRRAGDASAFPVLCRAVRHPCLPRGRAAGLATPVPSRCSPRFCVDAVKGRAGGMYRVPDEGSISSVPRCVQSAREEQFLVVQQGEATVRRCCEALSPVLR